jgi:HSP20 family molecular chaperone IbpA
MKNYVSLYDPFEIMDPFFGDFFDNRNIRKEARNFNVMKTDIKDEGDHYELLIDVPSVKKEDIKLSLENGYLTIKTEFSSNKEEPEKDENGNPVPNKWIRRERHYGSAERTFYVGDKVEQEDIKAKLDNGVLHLNINKVDEKKIETKKYIAIE